MDKLINNFINDLKIELSKQKFEILGAIDKNDNIHTFGTDSKIIGRLFEMITQPIIEKLALKFGFKVETPASQTIYPDIILLKDDKKIGIDIKSTYISSCNPKITFTLGSFASYMRNNTKNIQYKYTEYVRHIVIGFVYKRNGKAQESKVFPFNDRSAIVPPYTEVNFFVQDKYKISGEKPGSGNTENIGSFPTTNINKLINGEGPFSKYGHEIFDMYWKYYPKYREPNKNYRNFEQFKKWVIENINQIKLLYEFDKEKIIKKLKD